MGDLVGRFKLFGIVSCLGILNLFAQNAGAQTQADLETQVLGGVTEPHYQAGASVEDSSNSDVPVIKEEKEDDQPKEKDLQALEEAIKGPKGVPPEHILVVQRKYIQKEGRHEIAPIMVGIQPADSFRKQLQYGFSYTYHVNESFGIEIIHFGVLSNFSTGLNNDIRKSVNLETDRIEPVFVFGPTLQWTPLRSKAATDNSITYFEGYFLAGGGVSRFEDSFAGLAMSGVGFRVYLTKYAILKTELRDYMDFRGSKIDNRLNILAGASILLGGGLP